MAACGDSGFNEAPHVDRPVYVWHSISPSEAFIMAGYDNVPGEYVTYLKRLAEQYIAVPGESVDWPAE